MKAPTFWRLRVLAAHVCWLAALGGCGRDRVIVPALPEGLARLVDEADGSPVAGAKVMVMDPRYNVPVAGPFVSGADGLARLGLLPRTDLFLMVFGGVGHQVHALPDFDAWNPGAAPRSLILTGPVTGLAPPPPDFAVDILMRAIPVDSLPRIAGLVVDADYGFPLERVFVGLSPYLGGYQGETGPADDVTGKDGLFSVSQIPFVQDQETGNLIQITPLRFTCYGYRPVVWKYDPPNGSDNLDIQGVKMEMEWIGTDHRGVITGVLLRDGLPVGGVVVGLGVIDQTAADKAGPGLPGWTEVTDEFGRFIFGQLPPGAYVLQPGFALKDGVFFPSQPGSAPIRIVDRQIHDAGDLVILHEIEPRYPVPGQALAFRPASLNWTAVPGAVTYEVRFDRGVLPLTDTNSIELPESLVIGPGLHYWSVLARGPADELLGVTQIQAVFRLRPLSD